MRANCNIDYPWTRPYPWRRRIEYAEAQQDLRVDQRMNRCGLMGGLAASEPKRAAYYPTGHDLNDVQALADRARWREERLGLRGAVKAIGARLPERVAPQVRSPGLGPGASLTGAGNELGLVAGDGICV